MQCYIIIFNIIINFLPRAEAESCSASMIKSALTIRPIKDMELCLETCPPEKTAVLASLVFNGIQPGENIYTQILNNKSANIINVKLQLLPSSNISTKIWMIEINNKIKEFENEVDESLYKSLTVKFYNDYSKGSCYTKKPKQISTGNV